MKQEELTFEKYLYRIGFTNQSVKSYLYQFENFITVYPDAARFSYKDIMVVLEEIAKQKPNTRYRIAILSVIKKYYDYLIEIGQRDDHPCKTIQIKFNRDKSVIQQDLFSSTELELLMNREERYPDLKMKNQAVISLLIYQGLSSGEIANLKVQHIHLDEGKIFVKESRDLMRRHLEMHPKQYRIFDRYINESRKSLLKAETDKLIIGVRGNPITTGEVGYLVEQFKILFPGRNLNPSTIRQSVISNWLNEKKYPLEMVQLMAGHRWISTTQKYRHTSNDEKRILINRFHPLG
ncbi:MAG TPA: tyrosine-type recombinase/integrase [Flavobacteriales bacterium]|nr:tyrosine-type recombinase/integrase [Flavobacteriales bacterium]